MTANLLTLNSSKTEFLLIGLKKQLDKIHNSSLNTTHSVRNLGFIFDEHLTFSDQISAISKACYYHIRLLYPFLPRFHHSLHHCHLHRSLQTRLLYFFLSSGDCLEGKGENYQVCSVQYCVQQFCAVRCTHI